MTAASIEIYKLSTDTVVESIPVQYNPSEFSITYKGSIAEKTSISNSYKFQKTASDVKSEMSFKLVLDGYDEDEEKAKDVSAYVSILTVALQMEKDGKKCSDVYGCSFRWAEYIFKGMLTSLSANYTMFTSQGRPIRASVDIKLKGGLSEQDKEQARQHRNEWRGNPELYMQAYLNSGSSANWRKQAKIWQVQNPRKT